MKTIYTYLLGAVVLTLCSCTQQEYTGPSVGNAQQVEVTLMMQTPAVSASVTRGLDTTRENAIEELTVIWFDQNGNYVHHAVGLEMQVSHPAVSCRLLMNEGRYDIMVLANSRAVIEECFPTGLTRSVTLESFRRNLILSVDGIWNADPSSAGYRPVPMWGMAAAQNIYIDCTVDLIKLMRVIARVDVVLEPAAAADFVLEEVNVYRNYQKGLLVPDTGAGMWDPVTGLPTAPSLPTGTGLINTDGVKVTAITAGASCTGEIYLFDTPAGTDPASSTSDDNVCLVLGGKYNGEAAFYRVDFITTASGTPEYLDILRNHTYEVKITAVDRAGAKTAGEALAGRPANITYDITDLDRSGMNNIAWDGQHYLMVDTDSLHFYSDPRSQVIRVQTNHAAGFAISADEAWIGFTPASSPTTLEIPVQVTPQQNPSASDYRDGTLTVTAGELSLHVKVSQSYLSELTIDVNPTSLIFYDQPTAQTITVETYPVSSQRYVTFTGDAEMQWDEFPASPMYESSYTFKPKPNTTGKILAGIITVYITSADGRTASAEVAVRQYPGSNPFSVSPENPYVAVAQTQAYYWITAATDWYLKRTYPANIVTPASTGVQPAGSSQQYFSMAANNSFTQREIVFTFSSDDDQVEHEEVFIQEGAVPRLVFPITQGDSYSHTFTGYAQQSEDIMVDLNFPWRMALTGSLTGISASMSHQAGITYPCNSIAAGTIETISINSPDYSNGTGMPAAGTVLDAKLEIYNVNTDPYPSQVMGTIELKRQIPALFILGDVSPTTELIPRTGGRISVTAGANAPWSISTSTGLSAAAAPGNFETSVLSVDIPVNNGINDTIDIDLYRQFNGSQVQIASYRQPSYFVHVDHRHIETRPWILGTGDIFFAAISGNYPYLYLRAAATDGTVVSPVINIQGGTSVQDVEFVIDRNQTGNHREIHVQASVDGVSWTNVRTTFVTQVKDSYWYNHLIFSEAQVFSAGRTGAETMDWATAMGIDPQYNSITYYNTWSNIDRNNFLYEPTRNTGCGAWSETYYSYAGHADGIWRVPTPNEVQAMLRAQIEGEYDFGIAEGEIYHSAYDDGMGATRAYYIQNGRIMSVEGGNTKSQQYRIRCVMRHENDDKKDR